MNNMTAIPQNFKNNVDWIIGAYEDAGVTFPNGFQKDAIQNAVGARKTNKWRNWSCDISLVDNERGQFIVVEDSGTVGLTGNNTPTEEINKMMAEGKVLDPTQRLSRFTSMFNSGGNTTGGGLFGAGKSVYSVASEKYTYYFDSLREDGLYVANINKNGQVMRVALGGDEAIEYIFEKTRLKQKETVGTRVIIESPKKELVDSIKDGSIIPFIQESWWLIIQRFDESCSISVNKIPVEVPLDIKNGTHVFDLPVHEKYASIYTIKHFGLYVFEDGKNRWNGISYYRKGMKIGEIDIKDVPEKISEKYWGYIEVDEKWEEELSEIEDKVHFGVSKGKKNKTAYQYLKNYCNEKTKNIFVEWGYIKDRENENKKLKDELKKIAEEVQDLFNKLGFEDLGKGPKKADFDVRWQDIKYPRDGTERVTSGDEIKFSIRIKSLYTTDKKFEYKLYVQNPNTGTILSQIDNDKISIAPNEVFKKDFKHIISNENSAQYSENRIILSVKVVGSGKEEKKDLSYFFDIDRPKNIRETVNLSLHECLFPTEGSRRVNFGEAISKVCYRIENKRNQTLFYKLNVSTHNANDTTCPKIVDINSFTGEIGPFDEVITPYIDNITFEENIYKTYLTEGVVQLRARLIANDDDEQYEKGDKITSYSYNIYLNIDEKNGTNDSFDVQSIEAPEKYKRSWFKPGIDRVIYLNVGHAAYLSIQEYQDIQHEYLKEQMLKQYVLLYLAEGKFDAFGENGKDFIDLEPQEAVEKVVDKIEEVYYRSLR